MQVLHILWFIMILRVAHQFMVKGVTILFLFLYSILMQTQTGKNRVHTWKHILAWKNIEGISSFD